ncbi:MAG: inositol monophosphatase family protein [Cyanobacteriota bacterium]|nr:inositol monophosphatase family protein [Cyanobacteriota bacterium]
MSALVAPALIDDPLSSLIKRVAERQLLDFGRAAADLKPDGTLVTACDLWSDQTLVEGIQTLYPGEGVLSEEGDRHLPTTDAFWVVDPLDGTTNFAAGIPCWSISLARFEAGRPVLGILEAPPLGLRIIAKAGSGVWRNGVRLDSPAAKPHPGQCVSLCSRSIKVLQKRPAQPFPGKIRLFGVASLNLASVATGQTVAALEATPKLWDLAAAWLVLQELACPLRWLQADPQTIQPGTDLTALGFPVLAADAESTLGAYLPWAALLSAGDVIG